MQQDLGWRCWNREGLMPIFVCFIKSHMAWLPSRCLRISSSPQQQPVTAFGTPSYTTKSIPRLITLSTPFPFQSCCRHWHSSAWQSSLLTTTYHNTTDLFFNLIFNLIFLTRNTIIIHFHLIITLLSSLFILPFFFLHDVQSRAPAHNLCKEVLQYN